MNVVAWCGKSDAAVVMKALKVEPITTPPVTINHQPAELKPSLERADFIYIQLHGLQDSAFWYGSGYITAVTSEQLSRMHLRGTLFVANCYFPESPMLAAAIKAKPSAIIAAPGKNYTNRQIIHGAIELAAYVKDILRFHLPANLALTVAKAKLAATLKQDIATKDTLEFEVIYERGD